MYESFVEHEREHGGRNTTLDRIDVLKGYSPKNCRWATQYQQSLNKKNTLVVEYKGKKIPLKKLCDDLGKGYNSTYRRISRGYDIETALNAGKWERFNRGV